MNATRQAPPTRSWPAAAALTRTIEDLRTRHSRFVISNALAPVRKQLDRYGISDALGPDSYYGTADEALEAFHATEATSSD